ncbi:MAG TPA: hypothetical protein VMZ28_16270 [Kofleriaceae bacterium]|nr:hypothetical protein [Kofleriaceae bacterium]
MPREGIERISLKLRGKSLELDRKVTQDWGYASGSEIFTQRLYLASPGGAYLAYAHGKSGALHVRDRRGHERTIARVHGRDVRFSADERYLATVRSPAGGGVEVVVMELATGKLRALGAIHEATWLEWVADGVVASHVDPETRLPVITLYPLAGEPRVIADGIGLAARFTSARRGSRVMYFVEKRAYVVDTADAAAEPVLVGELPAAVNNAEMAPDGSEAAIVTAAGLYRARGAELALELLSSDTSVHTVWFSADGGQLAYATPSEAVVLAGDARHAFAAADYDLGAMRFRAGGGGLVLAVGHKAILWRPDTDARTVLADAGADRTMQGADVYDGGVVTWSLEVRRKGDRKAYHGNANEPFALAD